MITYTDIKRYESLPFEEYLKLEGHSHSQLKREVNGISPVFDMTYNIRIGSLVDAILTDPSKADMTSYLYPIARDIAGLIAKEFGPAIQHFQKQISFTGMVNYMNFKMPVTGRTDFILPQNAVIDLKVTKTKEVRSVIKYMGYENQLWHYSKLAQVNTAYIMIYSIPKKTTEIIYIDCSDTYNEFWAEKTLKFGRVTA